MHVHIHVYTTESQNIQHYRWLGLMIGQR